MEKPSFKPHWQVRVVDRSRRFPSRARRGYSQRDFHSIVSDPNFDTTLAS